MRRTLSSVQCDTDTAVLVGESNGTTLYRTKSRRFFAIVNGILTLWTDDQAHAWISEHCDADAMDRAFSTDKPVRLSIDLPPSLVSRLDAARGRRSRRSIIQAALEQYLKQ